MEFDVLSWKNHWDKATREVIEKRIATVPQQNFFGEDELSVVAKIIEAIIPGIHESIPIKEILGRELQNSGKKGVRLIELPWKPEMYKKGLSFLEKEAEAEFGKSITELTFDETTRLLESLSQGETKADVWEFPAELFFQTLVADITAIYASFPHAWNEMEFAGPAYPYGYYQLGCDERMKYEPELGEKNNGWEI